MQKLKWQGGKFGELPYVKIGNKEYYIRDINYDGKWKYRPYLKNSFFVHNLYKLKENKDPFKKIGYGERVFLKWYRLKFKKEPFKIKYENGFHVYEHRNSSRFIFFVNNESIRIYDYGSPIGGIYDSIAEAKKGIEPIILKAMEQHKEENRKQINFEDLLKGGEIR